MPLEYAHVQPGSQTPYGKEKVKTTMQAQMYTMIPVAQLQDFAGF